MFFLISISYTIHPHAKSSRPSCQASLQLERLNRAGLAHVLRK